MMDIIPLFRCPTCGERVAVIGLCEKCFEIEWDNLVRFFGGDPEKIREESELERSEE